MKETANWVGRRYSDRTTVAVSIKKFGGRRKSGGKSGGAGKCKIPGDLMWVVAWSRYFHHSGVYQALRRT